jgi:murein peptide amidase A
MLPKAIYTFTFITLLCTTSATAAAATEVEMQSWCNVVTLAIPQIKLKPCVAAKLEAVDTKSSQGRDIMLREYLAASPANNNAIPPRILVIGGIHGDELTAVSIVFRWMELLGKYESSNENGAKQPSRNYHWRVIPVLNPDGLLAKSPTRVNARGVDLNRNFPTTNWHQEAPQYWEKKTKRDPRRFPGDAPLSEPESQWLHEELTRFKPDVIISIHAPYGVLDFDGPAKGVAAPTQFGRLHLNRVGIYPGSLGNFGSANESIPVVTLELPHALKMPTEPELTAVWNDMQNWLKANLAPRPANPATAAGVTKASLVTP